MVLKGTAMVDKLFFMIDSKQSGPVVDEGWYQLTAVLNSVFLTDLKRIQTPHRLIWDFIADKTSTTC